MAFIVVRENKKKKGLGLARKMRRDIASMEKEVAAMLVEKKLQLVFKFLLVLVILAKRSNVYRI